MNRRKEKVNNDDNIFKAFSNQNVKSKGMNYGEDALASRNRLKSDLPGEESRSEETAQNTHVWHCGLSFPSQGLPGAAVFANEVTLPALQRRQCKARKWLDFTILPNTSWASSVPDALLDDGRITSMNKKETKKIPVFGAYVPGFLKNSHNIMLTGQTMVSLLSSLLINVAQKT